MRRSIYTTWGKVRSYFNWYANRSTQAATPPPSESTNDTEAEASAAEEVSGSEISRVGVATNESSLTRRIPTARLTVVGIPEGVTRDDSMKIAGRATEAILQRAKQYNYSGGEEIGREFAKVVVRGKEHRISCTLQATKLIQLTQLHEVLLAELRSRSLHGGVDHDLAIHAARYSRKMIEQEIHHATEESQDQHAVAASTTNPDTPIVETIAQSQPGKLIVDYWQSLSEAPTE